MLSTKPMEVDAQPRRKGRPRTSETAAPSLVEVLNLVRTERATTRQELERESELGRAVVADRLAAFNAQAGGSSRRIARFVLLAEPPSIDAGEITDKGYVNQRATLERRAAQVAALYDDPPGDGVVVV